MQPDATSRAEGAATERPRFGNAPPSEAGPYAGGSLPSRHVCGPRPRVFRSRWCPARVRAQPV